MPGVGEDRFGGGRIEALTFGVVADGLARRGAWRWEGL